MRPSAIASFLVLIAASSYPSAHAGEPVNPASDAETVAAVQKAAAGAEIHGIGVAALARSKFGGEDVKSWTQLVDLLRRREGAAARIWDALPKTTQEFAADDNLVGKLDQPNRPANAARLGIGVGTTIGGLLTKPDFYNEKAFKDVPLDKNLKDMLSLGEKRTYIQTLRMNRELLAAAFPTVINPVSTNYLSVPVHVKAGKPVILVLATFSICQWQVTVEDGAEVVGVILCGTDAQEVAGIKAPVVYRSGRDPYGKSRGDRKGEVIWASHDRNHELFPQLEAGVKKITGKSFTGFQGGDEAPKEGFVVKPSAK